MLATLALPSACHVPARISSTLFELPVPLVREALDVLDGLVSIGQHSWRSSFATVLQ